MEINIGAQVRCWDGEVGPVRYVVVDRATGSVDELVVDMGKLFTFDVVVPVSLVRRATRDEVELDCSLDELKRYPEYVVAEYVEPDPSWTPPPWTQPTDVRFRTAALPIRGQQHPRLGPGEVPIAEGMLVRCTDGPCGAVDEVLTDPETSRATSFVIRKGRLFHRDVVVPTPLVSRINAREIDLSISRKDLDSLESPGARAA